MKAEGQTNQWMLKIPFSSLKTKGAYYSRIYGVQPILLKMYLIMKTTIFSGVLRILVG
jgi:hypothetical protein